MKIVASCRLQLHGTAVWVDHMTTVVKLFQVQCHVLAVVPAAAAIPYVTCVRDSPDQTLVGLLLHPGLLLPFKMERREDMARLSTTMANSFFCMWASNLQLRITRCRSDIIAKNHQTSPKIMKM